MFADGHGKNYDFVERSSAACVTDFGPSLAVQADAEDADINTIVRRFGLTGTMPQNLRVPSFDDYDGVFDFMTAQIALNDARDSFMSMPAKVRAQFDNDPQEFLSFAMDPANVDEMVRLGLAIAKPVDIIPEPAVVPAKE
ncbi:MAG: internal scaffolding protein [Microvirus sp.]|nr:MAG: internal scaffolding protein [Microvirus sp.]